MSARSGNVLNFNDAFNKEKEHIHRQMMSSVSHDLKTPLASIIGSLEIYERMKDKLKPENKQALLDMALQEAYRLDTFITNILDMAKLENGQVKSRCIPCEIDNMLHDCITQLTTRLKDSKVEIRALSGAALTSHTDCMLLQRCVALVLDNAVKHGGTPSHIIIEYGEDDLGRHFIRIRDHGTGVEDARKEAIFSKYTRFVKQDMQNAGTGLGLAICRESLRILGGTVNIADAPEGGAVFTLTFPAK
jgi:K+-sensing histidine kinase KdpD